MLKKVNKRRTKNAGLIFVLFTVFDLLILSKGYALSNKFSSKLKSWSVFAYGGPATTVPLLDIIKLQLPSTEPYGSASIGGAYALKPWNSFLRPEVELNLSKHFEDGSFFSAGALFVLRWTKPPWYELTQSTFAFGNGLSYANEVPHVESKYLPNNSRTLYHIIIETEFALDSQFLWSALFRIHHRSGVYGLINGVTGGSDFLCLGLRRRL